MLTLFTIPKPFTGHIGTIQRNAIGSWAMFRPHFEIVLCGDESGTREAAERFNVRHLPEIAHNDYGTPLLDDVFHKVAAAASSKLQCYINTDIILLSDFPDTVRRVPFKQFVMTGRRWNLDVREPWDFGQADSETRLRALVRQRGTLAPIVAMDYFVFTANGKQETLPPFAVGRPTWDNWFIYHARSMGTPVINASRAITAIHQNHDYGHVPENLGDRWMGPEALANRQLTIESMGDGRHLFNLCDATHVITPRGVRRASSPRCLLQRCRSRAVTHPRWRAAAPLLDFVTRAPATLLGMLRRWR